MQRDTCSSCLQERLLVHSLFVFILPLKKCNPQNTYWSCWPTVLNKLLIRALVITEKKHSNNFAFLCKYNPRPCSGQINCPPVSRAPGVKLLGGRNASQKVEGKPFAAPDMLERRSQGVLVSDKNCLAWCVAAQRHSPFSPACPALLLPSPPTEVRAVSTE